ncbi:MAG: hypothetical protein QME52_12530 [Bacteroidota bacterium]|nr:hypothetical protein [Bacteroidota bacterium]
MNKFLLLHKYSVEIILFLYLITFTACSVKFITEYDENTDRTVSDLQRKFETFFISAEKVCGTPEGDYSHFENFYDDIKVDLTLLELRVNAKSKNEIQIEQVSLLKKSFDDLKKLHKLGLTKEQLAPIRTGFNVSLTAILKFEFAKRRGH